MAFDPGPTKHGYVFGEAASALQKAIRRADARTALYFALELHESGFGNYVWKRLTVVSAEDVYDCVTKEVVALNLSWEKFDRKRIFVSKAVLILCRAGKSRDADHANWAYDAGKLVSDEDARAALKACEGEAHLALPEYALDCHLTPTVLFDDRRQEVHLGGGMLVRAVGRVWLDRLD